MAIRAAIPVIVLIATAPLLLLSNARHPSFEDISEKAGVSFVNQASKTSRKYLIESMTGGVAALDYNNDGLLDLFFVNGAALTDPMPERAMPDKSDPRYWNRLFRNNRDGTFTDVTEAAGVRGRGYGMGVATGDFDNDGFTDLYVTSWPENTLYRNNGRGHFADVTGSAGVAANGWSTGSAFIDFDRDGDLDLFVTRYVEWDFHLDPYCGGQKPGHRSYCHPDQFDPTAHLLFRNDGSGRFTDISKDQHLESARGKGLGVAINDFDDDGWPDIAVANDSYPQQLFRNDRGNLVEVGLEKGLSHDADGRTFAGMGIDFSDYDNDGRPDLFINALANQRYALFRNTSRGFEYVTGPTGVGAATIQHSGWGARLFDYDNDGLRDLFVAQGHVMDNIELTYPNLRYRESLLLLRNNGPKFIDVSHMSGPAFAAALAARGAAFGDLDNNGSVDVAINCNDGRAVLLKNRGVGGANWLMLALTGRRSNRDAIGARVRVIAASGREQVGFVSTSGSYLSANDRRLHFGLGPDAAVKLIEIRWPSGGIQRIEHVRANQILKIEEPVEAGRFIR